MNKIVKKYLFVIAIIATVAVSATPPTPEPAPPPGTPIDGGISLLIASGLAYGLFRLRKK